MAKKIVLFVLAGLGGIVVLIFLINLFSASFFGELRTGIRRSQPQSGAPSMMMGGDISDIGLGLFERGSSKSPIASQNRSSSEGALTQRKVVKNGSLSLLVKTAEETAQKIQDLAARMGGFVSQANIYEVSDGVKNGQVTIRVPADRFDDARDEIKNLAFKVETDTVSAQDVTEQYTDLQARLRNLEQQEEQYLVILKQAKTVEDTLKVTQYLDSVRSQIEQIQGQLQYLSRQVDMSVISVSLTSEADVKVFGISWRPLFVAKQAVRAMLTGFASYSDIMIRFLIWLPVILLWIATFGVAALILWKLYKWIYARFFNPKPPAPYK